MTRLRHLGRPRDHTGPGDGTTAGRDADEPGTGNGPGPGTSGGGRSDTDPGSGTGTDEPSLTSVATRPGSGAESGAEDRSATDAGTGQEASQEEPSETARGGRRPRVLPKNLVPALCAALLVLVGCGFFYGAHQTRSTPSAGNHALTDAEATTRVAGDVGNALARVFSYSPDGLEATERAARSVLAGRAERQYTELMRRIRADVAAQRVTLSTQAVRTGVIELDRNSARLLVFLDQISHRGKAGATSAAAQLTVTARREDDQWLIIDIKTR